MNEDEERQEPEVDEESEEEFDEEEARNQMARMMASVEDMALSNLSMLATQAWHHLGLVPIPGSGEAKTDLEQAKLAIDLFDANLKVLSDGMDDEMRKDLKRTLADLQMNYVNKSG